MKILLLFHPTFPTAPVTDLIQTAFYDISVPRRLKQRDFKQAKEMAVNESTHQE